MGERRKLTVEDILAAIYVEDCHVSGMHDPTHTPRYICDIQLAALARRVLAVTHGVKLDDNGAFRNRREVNKVPRRIDEHGWYSMYVRSGATARVSELDRWKREGVAARRSAEKEEG